MMITVDKLVQALECKANVQKEEAKSIAEQIMAYFGFSNQIVDNIIDKSDRKLFYMLQEVGFLNSSWETMTLHNGKNWRIYYWYFSEQNIEECLVRHEEEDEDIYSSIPEEAWDRQRAVSAQ